MFQSLQQICRVVFFYPKKEKQFFQSIPAFLTLPWHFSFQIIKASVLPELASEFEVLTSDRKNFAARKLTDFFFGSHFEGTIGLFQDGVPLFDYDSKKHLVTSTIFFQNYLSGGETRDLFSS